MNGLLEDSSDICLEFDITDDYNVVKKFDVMSYCKNDSDEKGTNMINIKQKFIVIAKKCDIEYCKLADFVNKFNSKELNCSKSINKTISTVTEGIGYLKKEYQIDIVDGSVIDSQVMLDINQVLKILK